jgi:hypothetical protein
VHLKRVRELRASSPPRAEYAILKSPKCSCIRLCISSLNLLFSCITINELPSILTDSTLSLNSSYKSLTMPVTEILIPSYKQDEATREAFFSRLLPIITSVTKGKPGLRGRYAGNILSENGQDVTSAFKPVNGLGMLTCILDIL